MDHRFKLTLPDDVLESANRELGRLSTLDLRYDVLTARLRGRRDGTTAGLELDLRAQHVRERGVEEAAYTATHQLMSDFILRDLTSATAEPPPSVPPRTRPAGEA